MKRGLVIGKFLPIHEGHIALINFGATHCDQLTVSMSYTPHDVIDPQLRFSWIQEIFKDQHRITTVMVLDDFDNAALPWNERIRIWAAFIRERYGDIDIIFSSENYGAMLAAELGCEHLSFDPARERLPVSATLIRTRPFDHWEYIPTVVRPYFVKKVCFFGPESTGKSTMAKRMAEKHNTVFVPEVARELITSNDFSLEDIVRIGHAQYERIHQKLRIANKILFCDTDAITTQIYSQYYLGAVPEVLYELERKINYDHYFLFDIDVPWVEDGLRDLGDQRVQMFRIFREALESRGLAYSIVKGSWQERENFIDDKLLSFA